MGSEKMWEDSKFTPQTDLWHRDGLQQLKQKTLGTREKLIFRVTKLLDQISSFQKKAPQGI